MDNSKAKFDRLFSEIDSEFAKVDFEMITFRESIVNERKSQRIVELVMNALAIGFVASLVVMTVAVFCFGVCL